MSQKHFTVRDLIPVSFVILLIAILYYNTFAWLVYTWNTQGMYSHGFIIPLISGFLLYARRKEMMSLVANYRNALGLIIFIIAILIKLTGDILDINTFRAYSFIILLCGIILYLYGWKVFKRSSFSVFFLIFMVPIYNFLIKPISVALKLFIANLSVKACSPFGFPIFRDGVQIYLSDGSLEVADPCSGIRSLIALFALGVLYIYLSEGKFVTKIIMFLSIAPIAIVTNAVRVIVLILVAQYYHINASTEGIVHQASGIMVFVLAIFLFYLTGKVLGIKYSL